MANKAKPILGVGPVWIPFWATVLAAAVYFVWESVDYALYRDLGPEAEALSTRRIVAYFHAGVAIPILFIAPLQFHPGLRQRYPVVHRWTGRLFIAASICAAAFAIFLSFGYDPAASRPALFVFGIVWIFFSLAAWMSARSKDFATHRKFMIRSVAVGFAFVWVRLMRVTEDWFLFFIEGDELRLVAREYLCFIVPLLAVELWLTYWPSLKRTLAKRS